MVLAALGRLVLGVGVGQRQLVDQAGLVAELEQLAGLHRELGDVIGRRQLPDVGQLGERLPVGAGEDVQRHRALEAADGDIGVLEAGVLHHRGVDGGGGLVDAARVLGEVDQEGVVPVLAVPAVEAEAGAAQLALATGGAVATLVVEAVEVIDVEHRAALDIETGAAVVRFDAEAATALHLEADLAHLRLGRFGQGLYRDGGHRLLRRDRVGNREQGRSGETGWQRLVHGSPFSCFVGRE